MEFVLKMASFGSLLLTSKTSALSSSSPPSLNFPQRISKISSSVRIPPILTNSSLVDSVKMDSNQNSPAHKCAVLPEFMVEMKSEGYLNSVKNERQTLEDSLVSTAVAEFKGPRIFGVVRFALVNVQLVRIEANFSGLPPGKLGWSINEFGDLTRDVASTGKVFNANEVVGDLGTLDVDKKGEAFFSGMKEKLRVGDLIGRSIAVYGTEDKSDDGLAAAVIARSAGVGDDTCKRLCSCDGTTIWEANNSNIVCTKV